MPKSLLKTISKQDFNELDYILNLPRNITQKMFYQSMKQPGIITCLVTITMLLKDNQMSNLQVRKEEE